MLFFSVGYIEIKAKVILIVSSVDAWHALWEVYFYNEFVTLMCGNMNCSFRDEFKWKFLLK